MGFHVLSSGLYPFQSTKYHNFLPLPHLFDSSIPSTIYSSSPCTISGGCGVSCFLPSILFSRCGSRSKVWKTSWICHCDGSSSWNVALLSPITFRILNGLNPLQSSFWEGHIVVMFLRFSHIRSSTLNMGAGSAFQSNFRLYVSYTCFNPAHSSSCTVSSCSTSDSTVGFSYTLGSVWIFNDVRG